MLSALAHRGPDGGQAWCSGPAALAHAALWTTPESCRERQPITVSGSVIVADVRLDNRAELVAAFGLEASEASDTGDAELILRAYERWGEECASRLLGDFAFAVWDARNRRMFCARDHVGVKPLYYAVVPGAFLFATEIKALLTSPLVPYRLDPVRVAEYLAGLYDDRTITFYRDVSRLPAGHTLTTGSAAVQVRPYWSLEPSHEMRLGSDDEYTAAFAECFTVAVRCRLRSSHRVGCLLSGGLDTSSIVGTARRLRGSAGGEDLHTFTAIFPGLSGAALRRIDERSFVDAMVARGGLAPHYVRGDLLSPLTDMDRVLWHLDEAFLGPNLYLHWALYGAAQARGIRPLLDGIDGDTVVSHGLERVADLVRQGRVPTLARELRALSRRYRLGVPRLLWRFGVQPLVPAPVREALRRLRGTRTLADTVVKAELAQRVGLLERVEAAERRQQRPAPSAREAHRRALGSGLIPYVLEMADKAASAFSVEPRYPFLDRRLIELCLALPVEQKLQDGWTRMVLRRAMGGVLPEEVRWRHWKADLTPSFRRGLLEQDRAVLADVIVKNPDALEDYVDIPALRSVHDRYTSGAMSDADALTLHRTVVLGLWLRRMKVAA
jgi:asparagine synthase (glutamine-hydrolysing)